MKKSDTAIPDLSKATKPSPAFIGIKLVKFAYSYFKSTFYIWILWALNPEQVTGLLLLIATLGLVGISAVSAIIEYYHFDFSLTPEQLEIRSGIFNRKEQSIPFQKVQQIHISEDILHRFFGLVKIKIETAGSKAEEGLILALKPTLAAAIKSSIESRAELLGGTDETTAENEAQALWELTTKDLFRIGITRNHPRSALILLGFAIGFLDDITQLFPGYISQDWQERLDTLMEWHFLPTLYVFVSLMTVSIAATLVITFFRHYKQRLIIDSDRWIIRSGLIARQEWIIPLRKIHELSFNENPFQQWVGIGQIGIKTASSEEVGDKQKVSLPGLTRSHYEQLVKLVAPAHIQDEIVQEYKPHQSFRWRTWILLGVIPTLLLLLVPYATIGLRLLISGSYMALSYWFSGKLYESYKLTEAHSQLLIRKGYGWHSIRWTLWGKLQAAQMSRNLYEQRKNLGSIILNHGAGTLSFPFLVKKQAVDILNRALYRIELDDKDRI